MERSIWQKLRPSMTELRRFLRGNSLQNVAGQVAICIGNDAGDVDSLVSSIALAFCWSKLSINREENHTVVPVASFDRREFRLRGDARLLFKDAGVEVDQHGVPLDLQFKNDLMNAPHSLKESCSLILTDHNEPGTKLKSLFPAQFPDVLGIVDHHQDTGIYENARLRVVDPGCGSSCSLVASLALDHDIVLPDDLVTLLLGVILIDTRNFDKEKNKFSEVDVSVHKRLCEKYPKICPDPERQSVWFQSLIDARFDVSHLTVKELVQLDLKTTVLTQGRFKGSLVAFASMMDSMSGLCSRSGNATELEKDMMSELVENKFDLLVCMTKAEKVEGLSKKRKHVLVCAHDVDFLHALVDPVGRVPENLSEELKQNPLFSVQEILQNGFDVHPSDICKGDSLQVISIQKNVTRKTFMPTTIHLLESSPGTP